AASYLNGPFVDNVSTVLLQARRMPGAPHAIDRIVKAVDDAADEIVAFTSDLIRIPTVNPPGDWYVDCARLIGSRLAQCGFEVDYVAAEGRPEHTPQHPRVNVVGRQRGASLRPLVHLNGHFDVVPAGAGWTLDPFGGIVRGRRIYGRGACDMKAGVAAALYAVEAIRRAGVQLSGSVEISGTVDEESGGFAGVAYLCEQRRIHRDRTDCVIIPEPLNVDRICVGHRGVYWFEVTTHGRIGHGSMPFLGVNAIEHMGMLLEDIRRTLAPALASRVTAMPIVPDAARRATLNINGIDGGQPVGGIQTPCVADRCRAVFDRRFLLEEGFDTARAEIVELLERCAQRTDAFRYELRDLMVVPPVQTPADAPVIRALEAGVRHVLGREAAHVASPGTYDHKHVDRLGGVTQCVAYGPGLLDLAHQPDEWCSIDDLLSATKVLALAVMELTGTTGD
ncbi:MAG TPA: acetylornithine deacetylase/succinyl-diaminopimelate desuccinylase family protein, partial [Vicinamibacterales bacterium]|nr:acetylornithine deacetylase/succinyl-diaminopimelate desuccinylase family protein [Vicinamibacterales bacterium]